MEEFENRNTCILICTDTTGIGVNIQDVTHAIQWKISNYLIFVTLFQRIGRAKHDKTLLTVSIVFIEFKYVFQDDIALVRNSPFHDYSTTIRPHDRAQVGKIISTFYENNF